jgi:hypothetical protein
MSSPITRKAYISVLLFDELRVGTEEKFFGEILCLSYAHNLVVVLISRNPVDRSRDIQDHDGGTTIGLPRGQRTT